MSTTSLAEVAKLVEHKTWSYSRGFTVIAFQDKANAGIATICRKTPAAVALAVAVVFAVAFAFAAVSAVAAALLVLVVVVAAVAVAVAPVLDGSFAAVAVSLAVSVAVFPVAVAASLAVHVFAIHYRTMRKPGIPKLAWQLGCTK